MKYRLTLAYNGSYFKGSQKQNHRLTVYDFFVSKLEKIFPDVRNVVFSGRTDAGVHSIGQVVEFESNRNIPFSIVPNLINSRCDTRMRVINCDDGRNLENVRFSAKSRLYQYSFTNESIPFFFESHCSKVSFVPDLKICHQLAKLLVGKHDFKYFRKKGSNEKSTIREIFDASFEKKQFKGLYEMENISHYYALKIKANSFLYRMVRNIMGACFEVLCGKQTIKDFEAMLKNNGKQFHYSPAEAKGLCLLNVEY